MSLNKDTGREKIQRRCSLTTTITNRIGRGWKDPCDVDYAEVGMKRYGASDAILYSVHLTESRSSSPRSISGRNRVISTSSSVWDAFALLEI